VKILVADDEVGLTEILSSVLQRKGHHVDVANDGQKAYDLLQKNRYDLAFLDFTMPEKTGMELMEVIKEQGVGTKTILVTAYSLVEEAFIKEAGMDEYVSKPFRVYDIEKILEKYKDFRV
jgi:CheY-like chemotaxis protein